MSLFFGIKFDIMTIILLWPDLPISLSDYWQVIRAEAKSQGLIL